jgi:hypothetical protein
MNHAYAMQVEEVHKKKALVFECQAAIIESERIGQMRDDLVAHLESENRQQKGEIKKLVKVLTKMEYEREERKVRKQMRREMQEPASFKNFPRGKDAGVVRKAVRPDEYHYGSMVRIESAPQIKESNPKKVNARRGSDVQEAYD